MTSSPARNASAMGMWGIWIWIIWHTPSFFSWQAGIISKLGVIRGSRSRGDQGREGLHKPIHVIMPSQEESYCREIDVFNRWWALFGEIEKNGGDDWAWRSSPICPDLSLWHPNGFSWRSTKERVFYVIHIYEMEKPDVARPRDLDKVELNYCGASLTGYLARTHMLLERSAWSTQVMPEAWTPPDYSYIPCSFCTPDTKKI